MVEIVVLSGKGGTGKTSLTAAFAHLSSNHVICDLDVDAPDLHLLLHPEKLSEQAFFAGHEARIAADRCDACGRCIEVCRFGAVKDGHPCPVIDPLACEGCKVCVAQCPVGAIDFPAKHCGDWYLSRTRFGPLIHAQLFPAQENSGRLVALLRQKAREMAEREGLDLVLSDGPPGIGCPVISSLAGASLAIVVTEPTPSGCHDLERVIELCRHFKVPAGVIINKHDLNRHLAHRLEADCTGQGVSLLGRLPHDPIITLAMVAGQAITEYENNGFAAHVRDIWKAVEALTRTKAAA
jgi:MinD superfamily P-loop ATPase